MIHKKLKTVLLGKSIDYYILLHPMSTQTVTLSETQRQALLRQVELINTTVNAGINAAPHIDRLQLMVERFATDDITQPHLFFTIE